MTSVGETAPIDSGGVISFLFQWSSDQLCTAYSLGGRSHILHAIILAVIYSKGKISLCKPDWPGTQGDLATSASRMLELKSGPTNALQCFK